MNLGEVRVDDRRKNHDLGNIGFFALRPDRSLDLGLAPKRDVDEGGHEGFDDPPSYVATRHPILQILVADSENGASAAGLGGSLKVTF